MLIPDVAPCRTKGPRWLLMYYFDASISGHRFYLFLVVLVIPATCVQLRGHYSNAWFLGKLVLHFFLQFISRFQKWKKDCGSTDVPQMEDTHPNSFNFNELLVENYFLRFYHKICNM